jgi:rhomboid protease GluP
MAWRQTSGSVVCPSCRSLVGVNDATCYSCGRRNPGLWGFAPLVRALGQDLGFGPLVIGLCVILYAVSVLLSHATAGDRGGGLAMLEPTSPVLFVLGASGGGPVFGAGRWWTIFSAGWLHAGVLHIAMNLLWVRQLAPTVAYIYGPGRAIIIYTIAGACGFLLSSVAAVTLGWMPIPFLRGAGLTVGASAPIFGMFGALVCYGRMGGSSLITSQIKTYALVIFLLGLIIPGVDNYAHAGGFLGGYALARWLNPFREERLDHLLAALVCLLVTIGAIGFSVIDTILRVTHSR